MFGDSIDVSRRINGWVPSIESTFTNHTTPIPSSLNGRTEDCYWGHLAGCRTCLVHIGTAHTLEAMRSGYVHNVIESLEELMAIVGHEADEGEEEAVAEGLGAGAGAGPS